MFCSKIISRAMSRQPSSSSWRPPSRLRDYHLRTPENRPLRLPINYEIPRTPGRMSLGQKGVIMRLQAFGCRNRPVFHIVATKSRLPYDRDIPPIEQLGTYDPVVNAHGEKLVSLNIERINYYLAQGAQLEGRLGQLLGLAGLLPQHPRTYMDAWRNRRELSRAASKTPGDEAS